MNVRGEVFIAWGGNFELADAVAGELRKRKYVVQVGGAESTDYFLANDVIRQLKRASRAIVLAQPVDGALRPNLMFEWGMLTERLRPPYLHVFLLGIDRKDLPADVLGTWSEEIRETDVAAAARTIAELFERKVRQEAAKPLDVMLNWPRWKSWIRQQAEGEAAPDNLMLAGVLIHAIQPSFYFDDHSELREILRQMKDRANIPPELADAQRIARAAWTYYELTDRKSRSGPELKALYDDLAELDPTVEGALRTWMEIVRLDFRALTIGHIAEREKDPERKRERLAIAVKLFGEAGALLETLEERDAMWNLWTGYIRRNQGVFLEAIGDQEQARQHLRTAVAARRKAQAALKEVDPLLDTQLRLEVLLAENELAHLGERDDVWSLESVLEALEAHKPPAGRLGVWNRARQQFEKLCSVERPELLRTLKRLART